MDDALLQKAVEIANRAPDLHPWHVALQTCSSSADFDGFIVGLLHDSVEDGYATREEIDNLPIEVAEAVWSLTRGDDDSYWDYIGSVRLHGSALARRVKLADARVNLARCVASDDQSRGERYQRVIDILTKEES